MPFAIDYRPVNARLFQEVSNQSNKTIHLTSARDRRSRSSITNAGLSSLFLRLGFPARPELGDRIPQLEIDF